MTNIRTGFTRGLVTLLLATCAGACGGGGSAGPGPNPGSGGLSSSLSQFQSCAELRRAIVEDARQKIVLQAKRLRADGLVVSRDNDFAGAPGPAPLPGAPTPTEGSPLPTDFTDTNVQVAGVDEADRVETDGTHIYLLHNGELVILDSWPPEATTLRSRLAIEGSPAGMFVADGRALVISSVYDTGALGGDDACRYIGPPLPAPLIGAPVSDAALLPCGASFTKLTLIDLAGASPRVAREIYLEGSYTAARRHGSRARVVVQRGWGLPTGVPEPWVSIWSGTPLGSQEELAKRVDGWEAAALAALDSSRLDEWLPNQRERVDGSLVDLPTACGDVHVPPPSQAGDGATQIFALDMRDDQGAVRDTVVVGGALQVYANLDTLLLAQPDWSWFDSGEATDRTALHVFTIPTDSLETPYVASGFVPGTPLSQLAFDVRGGVIRVASTTTARELTSSGAPPTASRITTARVDGNALALLGSTGDLAPGERIYAARYIGDRAYLVTFLQIDPLFVVELADPSQPTVLGQVELPGFSEYIHPLGENHLLTIGRDGDPEGRTRGVALRIFDVSNASSPRVAYTQLLPGEGWSPAESDHLAFTYSPALGLLALPYNRYDGEYRSSLVLINVDAAAGFSIRGEVEHASIDAGGACPGPTGEGVPCRAPAEMRRGLFIEDWVYSISSAAVGAGSVSDPARLVAEVKLPLPELATPGGPPAPDETVVSE